MDLTEILKIPSVGKSIGEKIDEFVRTGSFEALDELRAQIPPGVREMTAIPGLGPKKAILLSTCCAPRSTTPRCATRAPTPMTATIVAKPRTTPSTPSS